MHVMHVHVVTIPPFFTRDNINNNNGQRRELHTGHSYDIAARYSPLQSISVIFSNVNAWVNIGCVLIVVRFDIACIIKNTRSASE